MFHVHRNTEITSTPVGYSSLSKRAHIFAINLRSSSRAALQVPCQDLQTLSYVAVSRTGVLAQFPPDPIASFLQHHPVACDPRVPEGVGDCQTPSWVSVEQLHRPDHQDEENVQRCRDIGMRYDIGTILSRSFSNTNYTRGKTWWIAAIKAYTHEMPAAIYFVLHRPRSAL